MDPDVCLFVFSVSLSIAEDERRWTSVDSSLIAIIVLFFFLSTGSCVDSLTYNRGAAFSTKDKDSDTNAGRNCAVDHQGAWWYKQCTQTNLNGLYTVTGQDVTGIYWYKTDNKIVLLKRVEMKLELVE